MRNITSLVPVLSRSLLTSLPHILLLCSLITGTKPTMDYGPDYHPNEVVEEEPEIKPCADNMQVCTSLFRYDPQTVLREGQYCACSGCSNPVWDEEDGMSITWYHHERADRMVQYKFCDRVVPKYSCKEDRDVALTIRATTSGWNPKIKKIWCACPGGKYWLKGWTKVYEGDETFWEYTYTCKKINCELDRPCVRRYMNAERDHATGYKFLCSCQDGQMCPLAKGPSNTYDEVRDEAGEVYTNGYCKPLKRPAEFRYSQEETSTQHAEHAHTEP